ncbi:MAG: methylenetetrahydrofolate reductase [Dehalococcoidales bacterium]|nr:methylenetetrahydrofolate reductase [Dehalococcoidales bacterium]
MVRPFRETLKSGDFIVTAEISPVRGTNTVKMAEHIELLKDSVAALNATDNQRAIMRYPSLGSCLLIKEHGGEPILQVSCRDRNRLAIQADLLLAWSRGVGNILCLTGDPIEAGEDKQARPVFDLDSIKLIHLVHTLNSGRDTAGNELDGSPDFYIGAAAHPSAKPIEPQQIKLRKKMEAGIDFVQTQAVYQLDELERLIEFIRKTDSQIKVLAGIVPIVSVRMAQYMNDNVPGITIPQYMIDELAQTQKGETARKGVEIAARVIRQIKETGICDGVHIMAIGREQIVPEILKMAGLS